MIVLPNDTKLDLLALIKAVGGTLNGSLLGLYKTNVTLTPNMDLATLTEADFDGYARSAAITWGTPFIDVSGRCLMTGDEKEFIATAPFVVPNTLYGYFIVDGAGTTLLYAEAFSTPRQITAANQGLSVLPLFDCLSANA